MIWTGGAAVCTSVSAVAMSVAVTACGGTTSASSVAVAVSSVAVSAVLSSAFPVTPRASWTIGRVFCCCSKLGLHSCHLCCELREVGGEGRALESGCACLFCRRRRRDWDVSRGWLVLDWRIVMGVVDDNLIS